MLNPIDLAAAGPWAVVVALGLGVVVGVIRKWWVPGWIYDEERAARKVSDTNAAATAKALLSLTRELRELRKDLKAKPDA